jgi:hypothetical protein
MSSTSNSTAEDAVNSLVSQLQSTYNSVSTKAVLSQLGIMGALSVSFQLKRGYRRGDEKEYLTVVMPLDQLGTLLAFSLLRPENKRVYAPKVS